MELLRKASVTPSRLAILPGTFNPPTLAHTGLAEAALAHAEEVLLIIPQVFPHKEYEGATLHERIAMLLIAMPDSRVSVGVTERGLFIDIAREIRPLYPDAELLFVCGRDAAERVANWRYHGQSFERMIQEFGLLVAARNGPYEPSEQIRHAVHPLNCSNYDPISSTEVRERMTGGRAWEHLVPAAIHDAVRRIYSKSM